MESTFSYHVVRHVLYREVAVSLDGCILFRAAGITSSCRKNKAMNKREVGLLIHLIKSKPILTNKVTNASTNRMKAEAWTSLTSSFNARNGGAPRTEEQLKIKWENLKKSARKRAREKGMNTNMTRRDVDLLIQLIKSNPNLTRKETNASTNRIKAEAWTSVTSVFNAKSGTDPKTEEQLKMKWDNLKKAARKRTQQMGMNYPQTDGGTPENISQADILEQVTDLLESTFNDNLAPDCGDDDSIASGSPVPDIDFVVVDDKDTPPENDSLAGSDTTFKTPDDIRVYIETSSKGTEAKKRKLEVIIGEGSSPKVKVSCDSPKEGSKYSLDNTNLKKLTSTKKGSKSMCKCMNNSEHRLPHHLAIERYYDKQTEKVELEIRLLKLQIAKAEAENML